MNRVRVDPIARAARAEGGALLADLDAATQLHGLATTTGVNSDTGLVGLTLGGGLGRLGRKHGLSCDNMLSAEIVTANGQMLSASEHENADLFWGLRGGGGNFGIVTAITYRLHPLGRLCWLGLSSTNGSRCTMPCASTPNSQQPRQTLCARMRR
jgi:FAD/FMN-containing dehydrogenase